MSAPQYDEFGNFIGGDLSDSESSETSSVNSQDSENAMGEELSAKVVDSSLVVPEPVGDVEDIMMVEEEDAQPITVPIVEPEKQDKFNLQGTFDLGFDYKYLESMRSMPNLCRNISIVGDLHHGKTSLCDLFIRTSSLESAGGPDGPGGDGGDGNEENSRLKINGPERSTLRSQQMTAHTRSMRYTDNRMDEQERGISVKSCPVSLLRPNLYGKNYLLNIMDTPGHVNFIDEVSAALRLSDGVVICVDVILGPRIALKKHLEIAAREGLSKFVLFVNCIDRLILEVRLPPADAYYKIRNVINDVNDLAYQVWSSIGLDPPPVFDPAAGNVVFGSARYSCIFTCLSFAKLHVEKKLFIQNRLKKKRAQELREINRQEGGGQNGSKIGSSSFTSGFESPTLDIQKFSYCLWGDFWYDVSERRFQKTRPAESEGADEDEVTQRTFVEFILKPLYKIFAHVIGEEKPTLKPTLEEIGIRLDDSMFSLDTPTLLKLVCSILFPETQALVHAVTEHIPSPKENSRRRNICIYTGNLETTIAKELLEMKENSERCIIHTTKNFHRPDDLNTFDAFGRVFCGILKKGDKVKVFGERYTLDDDEDVNFRTVKDLWIFQGRFRIQVDSAPAGSWVLIGGVADAILKSSTITTLPRPEAGVAGEPEEDASSGSGDPMEIFRPLYLPCRNVVRVACEPMAASDLPKLIEGLRRVGKAYPGLESLVEDSGAHVIICSGELAADCALHDLRRLYGDLEIRCADPVATVCETAIGSSVEAFPIPTPNRKNQFTITCEPLEEELCNDISNELISAGGAGGDAKELAQALREKYNWDLLASRSFWSFASDGIPSVLINDILPSRSDTRRKDVNLVKEFLVHGFQWVAREGPLIEEEVRNVKFKLIDAEIALKEPTQRGSGQIIPTVRRAAYAGLLTATPRLMEPMLLSEIICPADCVGAVSNVLARRRGHLLSDKPIPATPLEILMASVPAIDSFGLETDLRTHTSGQAFIQSIFNTWDTLPGDPLDSSIILRPLEPAPLPHLAREFLLKTRRRKGLQEDVSLSRFVDQAKI